MATFVSTSKFERWWRKAQAWFATQFASINVNLTPVEDKLDDVKSDVADVKTAVENIDLSTLATEANATTNKQDILAKIGTPATGQATDLFAAIAEGGGSGDDAHNLAAFFNLPEALPSQYHAMTTAEVLEIADEEWLAMYGFVAVPNTVHTVDASESERVFTTYMNPNKTYADYGWQALWDAQGETIALTDHPTAGRVIYTFNPINE